MNQAPQPPPEPKPYGPGQCVDCGAAVAAPIVRCKRCAEKRASIASREIAVDEIIQEDGPPIAKERFAYSLQELFGVMTLAAVILAAFVITPIAGFLACLILLPAATRMHRLLRVADTLNAKLDFSTKLSLYFKMTLDNIVVGVVGLGFIVLDVGIAIGCIMLVASCIQFVDPLRKVHSAVWITTLVLLAVLLLIVVLTLAGWFSKKIHQYFEKRWRQDKNRILFLASAKSRPNSIIEKEPTSPFDAID